MELAARHLNRVARTSRLSCRNDPAAFTGCVHIIALAEVADGDTLLAELYAWQTQDRFVYAQEWAPGMLVMWDNRSVLHRATGGYEGFDRLLHRTTIGERTQDVRFDTADV